MQVVLIPQHKKLPSKRVSCDFCNKSGHMMIFLRQDLCFFGFRPQTHSLRTAYTISCSSQIMFVIITAYSALQQFVTAWIGQVMFLRYIHPKSGSPGSLDSANYFDFVYFELAWDSFSHSSSGICR